jgi:hypothetical protein
MDAPKVIERGGRNGRCFILLSEPLARQRWPRMTVRGSCGRCQRALLVLVMERVPSPKTPDKDGVSEGFGVLGSAESRAGSGFRWAGS